jgi:anaerobic C4-dicarboxylate transporter
VRAGLVAVVLLVLLAVVCAAAVLGHAGAWDMLLPGLN